MIYYIRYDIILYVYNLIAGQAAAGALAVRRGAPPVALLLPHGGIHIYIYIYIHIMIVIIIRNIIVISSYYELELISFITYYCYYCYYY